MGIAHDIISQQKQHQAAQATYYLQLGLNYLWSLLYFKYKLRGAALIDSYILFSAVVCDRRPILSKTSNCGLFINSLYLLVSVCFILGDR